MATQDTRIHLTGGASNTNPLLSLGGAPSTTLIGSQTVTGLGSLTGLTLRKADGLNSGCKLVASSDTGLLHLEESGGARGAGEDYSTTGPKVLRNAAGTGALVFDLNAGTFSPAIDSPYTLTVSAIPSNLFGPLTEDDLAVDVVRYRCLSFEALYDYSAGILYVPSLPDGCELAFAIDPVGFTFPPPTGGTIADENTEPSGVGWSIPGPDLGTGVDLGNLPAGGGFSLWVRLTILAGTTPNPNLQTMIVFEQLP